MKNKNTLLSHLKIAGIVTEKAKVLDLGCGNGDLMYLLEQNKKVIRYPIAGYWVDIGKPEDFKSVQEFARNIRKS